MITHRWHPGRQRPGCRNLPDFNVRNQAALQRRSQRVISATKLELGPARRVVARTVAWSRYPRNALLKQHGRAGPGSAAFSPMNAGKRISGTAISWTCNQSDCILDWHDPIYERDGDGGAGSGYDRSVAQGQSDRWATTARGERAVRPGQIQL